MNTLKKHEENIIDAIVDADATRMATSLDRALTHIVQSNLQYPCGHFEDDYYNVDRLRNAIRNFAQSDDSAETRVSGRKRLQHVYKRAINRTFAYIRPTGNSI